MSTAFSSECLFDYLQDLQSYIFPQKGKDFSIEK